MGSVLKSVTGAVSGITSSLMGGDKSTVQGNEFSAQSPEEKQRLDAIEKQINDLFGEQGSLKNIAQDQNGPIQSLFANNLKSFLTSGGQQTPEDLKRASDFVDQTFTNPTQKIVDQNVNDYQSQAQGRAAALGRNPNLDIATQQAIAGEGLRQNIGLQAERGSRIQQASNDQYNRTLGSLNAGVQGSGYLNNLAQQAFSNQMNLLNGRTGLAQIYQKERSLTKPAATQTSSGLFNNLSSLGSGLNSIPGIIGGISGGLGAIGGSIGGLVGAPAAGAAIGAAAPLAIG